MWVQISAPRDRGQHRFAASFDDAQDLSASLHNDAPHVVANIVDRMVDGELNCTVECNPLLGPLQMNGGTTETHRLQPGSPARDTISGPCLATDQTGYSRPYGAECDTGAWEYRPKSGCQIGFGAIGSDGLDPAIVAWVGAALIASRRRQGRTAPLVRDLA